VSMYVTILSGALDDWVDQLTVSELIDYTLLCRDAVARPDDHDRTSSEDALAAEIAYDRALIRLCERHGINVDRTAFMHPREARLFLEACLSAAGVSRCQNLSRVASEPAD
jgi:hypothetical protein